MAKKRADGKPASRPKKPPGKKPGVLTEQQKLFIQHWLRHRNASRAAREAGYSPHCAAEQGYRLLRDPQFAHVQNALREAKEQDEVRWTSLRELTLQHVHNVLASDPADLEDENGNLKPLRDIDPEARAAIQEFKETEFLGQDGVPSNVRKHKTYSKNEAATLAAKISGLTKDRIDSDPAGDLRTARHELTAALAALGPREGLHGGAGGEEPEEPPEAVPEPDGPAVP